jgi:hypothetical protein
MSHAPMGVCWKSNHFQYTPLHGSLMIHLNPTTEN